LKLLSTRWPREEPALVWWVPHVTKKRNHIICSICQRAHKKDSKFGIRIPRKWDEAITLDNANGNTQFQDSVHEEMTKVQVAFRILEDGVMVPPTYQQTRCHLIFDLKIENFRRKARFVAGGHTTKTPVTLTFSSVVLRESVLITLTLAPLNDLEVKPSDIENSYLMAPVAEKIWTVLGPKFGSALTVWPQVVRSSFPEPSCRLHAPPRVDNVS
jgi:hypothetical protein